MPENTDPAITTGVIEISYQGWLLIGGAAMWVINKITAFILKIIAFRFGATPPVTGDTNSAVDKSDCADYRTATDKKLSALDDRMENGLARINQRIDNILEHKSSP
jgi:hypothetical protein